MQARERRSEAMFLLFEILCEEKSCETMWIRWRIADYSVKHFAFRSRETRISREKNRIRCDGHEV
jgi:hypothetical protein